MPVSSTSQRVMGCVGAAVAAAVFVALAHDMLGTVAVAALAGAATFGALIVLSRQRIVSGPGWWWFSLGIGFLIATLFLRFTLLAVRAVDSPLFGLQLATGITGYALVALSLLTTLSVRGTSRGARLDALLDAFVAATAVVLLLWTFSQRHDLPLHSAQLSAALFLPALAAAVAVLAAETAGRRAGADVASSMGFVSATMLVAAGELLGGVALLRDWPVSTVWLITPLGGAAVVILFASVHPSLREAVPWRGVRLTGSPRQLLLAMSALGLPPLVLLVGGFDDPAQRPFLSTVCVALAIVATIRVVKALRLQAASEARLRHEATHDRLTNLYNRYSLMTHLKELLASDEQVAVMLLDLARFKLVNDSSGHHVGDELLALVARRLCEVSGSEDWVARVGGDEFAVVTSAVTTLPDAVAYAAALRDEVQGEVVVGGVTVPLDLSIGVTVSGPGSTANDLLREADTAIGEAKRTGGSAVVPFDESMSAAAVERAELERDLHFALTRGELELNYQPIVDLVTGRVSGFEALLRWHHPERGSIPPPRFIPIAEDTGLIVEIGAWVLDTALTDLLRWRALSDEYASLTMSVNVSARQLTDPDFVHMVKRAITRHRIDPTDLCLELTESIMVDHCQTMERVLGAIRALGVGLSIDDFGTGYSSLAYVQRYPFTTIKIDRSFVELLDDPDNAGELVGAIVAMADALHCTTIAEGVETLWQAERLLELGCPVGQGFYYSRPLPADAIPTALTRLGIVHRPTAVPTSN